MPRRAKTSLQPLHFAGIAVLIALVAGGGWYLLGHRNVTARKVRLPVCGMFGQGNCP